MTTGTIVFIFLIDDFVPGGILNETLENVLVTHTEPASIDKCDSSITDPLLQTISRQLNVLMVPEWLLHEDIQRINLNNTFLNNTSYETLLNVEKVLETSLETDNNSSLENIEKDLELDENEIDSDENGTVISRASSAYVGRLPFLVAIFESLENVTAQTCAGTLIASEWVLTAANCVNLLANLYNVTNEQSMYTIITNATDPLSDGVVHNVTEIRVHPNSSDVPVQHIMKHLTEDTANATKHPEKTPSNVALMRIAPPVDVDDVEVSGQLGGGRHVTVYGWIGHKDESGQEMMRAVAFDARALLPLECSLHYNVTEDFSQLCLATGVENSELVHQMTWGGPVVTPWGVFGVARGDGNAPLAAWPLAPHAAWINQTICNT